MNNKRAESFFNDTKYSLIIPAYNEEEGLPIVLNDVFKLIDESFEVIVVDDGSSDRTREVAQRFPCRVISHERNSGKGAAMKTGIKEARGENIIFIDADNTYPPEGILALAKALENYDMALASRKTGHENIPAFNRIGNAMFRNSIRYIYGFQGYDPLTGLYGMKRTYLKSMNLESKGFGIESEICIKAARMGLRVKDIHITYRDRVGKAKLNGLKDGYRIFKTILKFFPLVFRRIEKPGLPG
ncbi:glycosyltransferase family 2 protein [Pelotomaculum terephthalicicum JT]|uniref:glycosyltransferase family 2 protein n=1 Tax=Pelotomaculum TaxID=191373 RepID=UPI0009CEB8D2|nr:MULTISPECIES: glycosyltransferase family 2 protein [Pelotomaculum]MCG9969061.1 glycosyltransferase family 2 protein [Pelotomaculum terephthalicicum JT]OPX87368.1 MAG: Undecaprenyl-phosphate mannosyltransferase [Pelotomaculum sp. PtaB.Bin117]OPY62861.1 MAG: Undecaprenyl-phosphate mannosyltransferase [Pelotomaculum sp. PtaU1.Bin065]